MYINVAYLKNMLQSYLTPVDYADDTVALKILCCGFYKITDKDETIVTERPGGRKDYQLLYFHNGQGHFSLEEEEAMEPGSPKDPMTTVSAGQMVLFRPGQRQVYEYYASDRTQVYWIHFTGNAAETLLNDNGFAKREQIFWGGISIAYQELWQKMIRELQLCKKGYEQLLALLFQELLVLIGRNRENRYTGTTRAEQEVDAALHYFSEHYASPITVEQYAASRFITPCWFIRCFRQYTGVTPLQYIISLRMANAREMLHQSYSVSEVASMVGYNDPLYFSRLFKRNVGIAPKDYQKAMARQKKGKPS